MQKNILIAFFLLLAISASASAQESNAVESRGAQTNRLRVIASSQPQKTNAAQAVYINWKQTAPADEVSRLQYALATVTRRTDAGAAEVEFWVVGMAPHSEFEIRPIYSEKLPNGEIRQEQTGEANKCIVKSIGESKDSGMGVTFSVSPNTNQLEVKWTRLDGDNIRNSTTVHILLKDELSENFTRIIGGR